MPRHVCSWRYLIPATALIYACCSVVASAGQSFSEVPAARIIAQAETLTFEIEPQELKTALTAFAEASGWQLFYTTEMAEGRRTSGLSGQYTPEDGLRRLLAGTGMDYRLTGSRTVTLIAAETPQAPVSEVPLTPLTPSTPVQDAQKPIKVPEVVVKEVRHRETAELNNLPPEYAGGDVASGGRVGNLGNRNIMDTPFTQMNYTSKLIQNQQTRFLTDVLRNDPSVQLAQPTATGFTNFAIRGFRLSNDDILFNGFAITPAPNGSIMTESIERVEILRGPSALLNGASPSGSIGGMINLVPKYAGDEALTRITAQYLSDTQGGGHVDLGRRFGSHKQFGLRMNGVYRKGNPSIDHASRESALASVGLDYRGDIVRLMADFGYQQQEWRGMRRPFLVGSGVTVLPEPPNTRTNANQPWEFNDTRALYGTLRGEVDVTKHITAFAGFGMIQNRRKTADTTRRIIDTQGTLPATDSSSDAIQENILTFDAGLRGSFDTGPIHHRVVAAYTQYAREFRKATTSTAVPASNIYNPVLVAAPPASFIQSYDNMQKENDSYLSSGMLGDTLSVLDERVQLTAGVRFQQIKNTNFNTTSGAVTDKYDKAAATPMVGLVVKPWKNVSLYGNYIEGLQQGPTAPLTAVNAGEIFAPFVSKGYEAGIKVDFGRITTSLAGFQLTQPSAFINPDTNVFEVGGEQRNRGVEFMVFGEVTEELRLLGGTTYMDTELTKTESGLNQGNSANNPPFQLTVYGEYDVPFLNVLTVTSRVTHVSSQFINFENTQKIPSWTQWDLGARYRLEYMNGKPITLRANIENLLDTSAWYGSGFAGQVFVRDARTFLLSATVDF
ncbi:MAG: TonB-dependent receptor [Nitrospira sp.]